jgi:predicted RNA polymerase sigma factor
MEASPNWFKPHWALAQLLQRSGRHTEALAEAQRAIDLDGGKAPEISQFLQSITASRVREGKTN